MDSYDIKYGVRAGKFFAIFVLLYTVVRTLWAIATLRDGYYLEVNWLYFVQIIPIMVMAFCFGFVASIAWRKL